MAIQEDPPPPPGAIQRDEYAAADQARKRLSNRGLFASISVPSLPLHRKATGLQNRPPSPSLSAIAELERSNAIRQDGPELVNLVEEPHLSAELDENYDKDVYRWAILYENQRGATFFSTPYYSPLTLLPLDPPPFTIPAASRSVRRHQPTVSLEDYPLPDGSWKWVSRSWMIDMRGDGQVQYDGFEYSRSFRSKKWGPSPGPLSSRGLVRRRRWIRLMMRPAQLRHDDTQSAISNPGGFSTIPEFEHHEEGATRPPSVILTISDDSDDAPGVWQGNSKDWDRCHTALRRLTRDGRKLELWAIWLGIPEKLPRSRPSSMNPVIGPSVTIGVSGTKASNEAGYSQQRLAEDARSILTSTDQPVAEMISADAGVSLAKAPKDYVAAVIRTHGSEILGMFIYPDSRARLLLLLGHVGLLPDLRAGLGLGVSDSVQILDFWSYTRDVGGLPSPDS